MELAGVYMVFLALWDKLAAHDRSMDQLRDGPSEVPSALCQVQTLGQTVGPVFYDNGYKLQAQSLGEVFEILNIRQPEDYRRRSLSVGDVVVDPTGVAWVCQSCGWRQLEIRNEADPRQDFTQAARVHDGDLRAACKERNADYLAELEATNG